MKKIAMLVGLVAALCSCVTTPLPPEELIIQQVIEVDRPKDVLFDLAMEWVAKTFRSAQAVIQYQDKEAGKIVGKGNMPVTYLVLGFPSTDPTFFTFTVEIRDGRARATVEDAYLQPDLFSNATPLKSAEQMKYFKPEVLELFASLEAALSAEETYW